MKYLPLNDGVDGFSEAVILIPVFADSSSMLGSTSNSGSNLDDFSVVDSTDITELCNVLDRLTEVSGNLKISIFDYIIAQILLLYLLYNT